MVNGNMFIVIILIAWAIFGCYIFIKELLW